MSLANIAIYHRPGLPVHYSGCPALALRVGALRLPIKIVPDDFVSRSATSPKLVMSLANIAIYHRPGLPVHYSGCPALALRAGLRSFNFTPGEIVPGLSCPRPAGRCASLTDQNRSRRFCQPLCHDIQDVWNVDCAGATIELIQWFYRRGSLH